MNKPMSVSAVLQEGLPRIKQPAGINLKNRYEVLRDRSSSTASRNYSPGKRPRSSSPEPVRENRNLAFTTMAGEEEKIAAAKAIVARVKAAFAEGTAGMPGPLRDALLGIAEWMEIMTGVQEATASVVVDSYNKVVNSPRKSRRDETQEKGLPPQQSEEEQAKAAKKKKFVQEVKEAERCSLIFRTNMGMVPVMNPDTMKKRFSLDLAAKAAEQEKKTDGRPSVNVAAQLDDALAMVSKMEYFGRVTKKATKKGKPDEQEDFYTIPVRLFYKDKETREAAEARMRELCKINGTTPYHRTLRTAINRAIEEGKKEFPESFIQVRVDAEKMLLKVSRRKWNEKTWFNNYEVLELPESVLDLSRAGVRNDAERPMETETSDGQLQG